MGAFLCALRPASAHPLGPASVDHYSHLNLTPGKVILVYTLDMAEIATVGETRRIDTNGDGTLDDAEKSAYARTRAGELAAGLHLSINGQPLALTPVDPKLSVLIGQANLPTLRLSAVMRNGSRRAGGGPPGRRGASGLPTATTTTPAASAGGRSGWGAWGCGSWINRSTAARRPPLRREMPPTPRETGRTCARSIFTLFLAGPPTPPRRRRWRWQPRRGDARPTRLPP